MKKLPIYEMEISSDKDGVFAISVVEDPAIEVNFMAFSKNEKPIYKLSNEEDQQVITGPALIPDKLIYRYDDPKYGGSGAEYYIKIKAEVIKETAMKFFKDGNQRNTTLDHDQEVHNTTYYESWLVEDPTNDKSNALGFSNIPKGTWMVSMKVDSKILWEKIKTGEFYGFSIEGYYDKILVEQKKQKENRIMEEFMQTLKAFLSNQEVKYTDVKLSDGSIVRIDKESLSVNTISDGKLELLKDGNYKLQDGTNLFVKAGKKSEIAMEDKPEEKPTDEVKADTMDFVLEDGTVITIDTDTLLVTKKEDGSALADGHYVLDTGEEFDVKDGMIVLSKSEDELKKEKAKAKIGLSKVDKTKLAVELGTKIIQLEKENKELESKITELENQPAVDRTSTNEKVDFEKLTVGQQYLYMVKKANGLLK